MARITFASTDRQEVEGYFSAMWTASRIGTPQPGDAVDVYLSGQVVGSTTFVYARYGAPMWWTPQPDRDAFAITTAYAGLGDLREGDAASTWSPGRTLAMAATSELTIAGGRGLQMGTTLIRREVLTAYLEHWLGRRLDAPLAFERQALTGVAQAGWAQLEGTLRRSFTWRSLPPLLGATVDQRAANILVNLHRHNYTDMLARTQCVDDRRLRAALHFIRHNVRGPATIFDVALYAECTPAALARTFRERLGRSVGAVLKATRLDAARLALLGDTSMGSIASIEEAAAVFGFVTVQQFRKAFWVRFGEPPDRTLASVSFKGRWTPGANF